MNDSDKDDLERRFDFQRENTQTKEDRADRRRREDRDRQDAREERRRADQKSRDQSRAADRAQSRQQSRDMYEVKRDDQLADQGAKQQLSIAEEQEVTRREILLQELGAKLYAHKLNLDYNHDIRTRNLDLQEYKTRSEIDTGRILSIDDNTARNMRKEIIARLKSAVIEKLADHAVNESAKRSAHTQNIERIKADSDAEVRAIWAENEAKKDFELFMSNLRQESGRRSTAEIAEMLRKMDNMA